MNRLQQTTIAALKVGDRFYKAADKKKMPLVLVDMPGKMKEKYWFCEGFVYDHKTLSDHHKVRNYKEIKHNVEVIFLRHESEVTA